MQEILLVGSYGQAPPWRSVLLRVSGFKEMVQAAVINMPFTGDALFGNKVLKSLQSMKKENEAARERYKDESAACIAAPPLRSDRGEKALTRPRYRPSQEDESVSLCF